MLDSVLETGLDLESSGLDLDFDFAEVETALKFGMEGVIWRGSGMKGVWTLSGWENIS